jgi:prolyl oligopeptidase
VPVVVRQEDERAGCHGKRDIANLSLELKTRREDLTELLHGVPVADPYRWLEDGDSPEVRAWDEAQNEATRAWLGRGLETGASDALRTRVKELLSIGHVGAPAIRKTREGGRRYFHVKRTGTQEQAVLLVRDGVDGEDRVLVDPAPLSADGTTAIDWWNPSRDGALVAWGLSEGGSEESTLRVRDVATGRDLPDRIPHTRHATVAWMPDGATFY